LANGDEVWRRKAMPGEANAILREMAKSTEYVKEPEVNNTGVTVIINTAAMGGVTVDGEVVQ
jgi:hypothetical protein